MLMADIIWGKSNYIKKCIMMYKNTALLKKQDCIFIGTVRDGSCLIQKVILLVRAFLKDFKKKFCEKMINYLKKMTVKNITKTG